jgi:hypothetical protein
MISLTLARQLKSAGLIWKASSNDFFAIPDRGMDERLFVLSDMQAQLDLFRGWPVVTFHGTAEWALDYILTSEVVWMPREEQLRETILAYLPGGSGSKVSLYTSDGSYTCTIQWQEKRKLFRADSAGDAYGSALLYILENERST